MYMDGEKPESCSKSSSAYVCLFAHVFVPDLALVECYSLSAVLLSICLYSLITVWALDQGWDVFTNLHTL